MGSSNGLPTDNIIIPVEFEIIGSSTWEHLSHHVGLSGSHQPAITHRKTKTDRPVSFRKRLASFTTRSMKIRQSLLSALLLPSLGGVDASAATNGALSALKSLDYRYFVAGGTCAAISHGLTTPIDVVKTKIQADPKKYDQGMRQAAVDIIKTQGPGALLGGLGPTVVGYGVEGAMKVRKEGEGAQLSLVARRRSVSQRYHDETSCH